MNTRHFTCIGAVIAAVFLASTAFAAGEASVVAGVLQPDAASKLAPAVPLSAAERAELQARYHALRDRIDAQVNNNPGAQAEGLPQRAVPETAAIDPNLMEAPADFKVYRNIQNPFARTAGVGSTLAEPASIVEGQEVFYTGNTYASYTLNAQSGSPSWVRVTIPAGPADAPIDCCDHDVVYDKGRGLTIWSVLYVNSALTNGVVRLFVRQNVAGTVAPTCSYTIDPGGTGTLLPDYPHLGLSNNFLYLTTNNLTPTAWTGAQVRRLNLDQMAQCVGVATNTFTYTSATTGQRVFVPVNGATETMYWGMLETTTSFRVFSWPEAGGVSSVLRTISASAHFNPDCRGGTNNTDWIDRSTAWSIAGFRMRGTVAGQNLAFYWNSAPVGTITQAHVRSAVFRLSDLLLIAQPHIFNQGLCFGYPNVASNARGDIGLTIAAGGKAGGAGPAVKGYVGIDDSFTNGVGVFGSVYTTASGTHNPADNRYGDYFSIQRNVPCDLGWAATNYALNGGTAVANVNARHVEFIRARYNQCSDLWKDENARP